MTPEELRYPFARYARAVAGGHMRWAGPVTTGPVPVVFVGTVRYTAARAAFVIAQGREPDGYVKSGCGAAWCVAPGHQADRRMRADALRQARAAVRAAFAGSAR